MGTPKQEDDPDIDLFSDGLVEGNKGSESELLGENEGSESELVEADDGAESASAKAAPHPSHRSGPKRNSKKVAEAAGKSVPKRVAKAAGKSVPKRVARAAGRCAMCKIENREDSQYRVVGFNFAVFGVCCVFFYFVFVVICSNNSS